MWKDRPEVMKLAKEFVELCDKNKIWYTADNGSLLGAIRHNGMIPWDDDFDVMMTPESYAKLKKLYPNNVVDSDLKGYPLTIPKFMSNRKNFLKSAVFVDIFIVVPSNDKQIKKFRSFRNKTRFAMQTVHSTWVPFDFPSKLFKVISWPFKWMPKPMSYKEAEQILRVDESESDVWYTIDNPVDPLKINYIKELSFKTKTVKFENFKVKVPVEYDNILRNKYGNNYMAPNKFERAIEHLNAVSIIKVKRNKEY